MASPVPGGTCSSPTAAASESGGSGPRGQSWGIPQSADPAHPSRGSSPALPRLRPSPPGAPPPLPQSTPSLGLCLRRFPGDYRGSKDVLAAPLQGHTKNVSHGGRGTGAQGLLLCSGHACLSVPGSGVYTRNKTCLQVCFSEPRRSHL